MGCLRSFSKVALAACAVAACSQPTACYAFAPVSFVTKTTTPLKNQSPSNTVVAAVVDPWILQEASSSSLLAYSDDPLGDLMFGANGVVVAGILAAFIAIGVGFVALVPKVGSAKFTLTEEEEEAVYRVVNGFDSKPWEKELTEAGTKGYVNRRRQAVESKEAYQKGKLARDMKDKSLRYSEADLGFVACLLRAAQPLPGSVLVDLGSGCGRSTLGCATIFPEFSKCVGIEFIPELVTLANGYKSKVKGKTALVEFRSGDFAEEDLSEADLVFVGPASYMSDKDLLPVFETLRSGAKVMTVDKRLGAGFELIAQVDDPSGDLVLNTGFVYAKL
eukprot:scaffold85724_cov50-Attheya_sp.AAC.10